MAAEYHHPFLFIVAIFDSTTMTHAKTSAVVSKLEIPVERSTVLDGNVVDLCRPSQSGSDGKSNIPKGRNVSGRSWKVRPQKRASSLKTTRANNQTRSFAERQAEKRARQETLELQAALREERRQAALEKRERRLDQEKRRAENEFRNLQKQKTMQTLNLDRVGTTLKAMSKKQLRQIKKTRVNPKTGVVELVPAYAK